MELLQLLHGQPVVVPGEPDQPQVAGSDHGDRGLVGGRRDLLVVEVDDAVVRLSGKGGPRHGRADALAAGDLGEEGVHEGGPLGLGRRLHDGGAPAHQVAHDLAQALPVALLEREAEALAVVGQDDELVRPRRILRGLGERPDRLVDPIERLERLHPLRAAMVGELVVVGEVRVDHVRAAVHLLDDQRDVDVAQEHVARGTHAGVLHAAVHLRRDARAAGPSCLVALLEELAQEERERSEVAARAQEEPEERLAVPDALRFVLDGRGRDVRARGVTRDEIADADAVVRQEAFAVGHAPDDLRRVDRAARDHQLLSIAFVPAERRDPVVVPVQDPGLAGGRHRRQDGLPRGEDVAAAADPARRAC